MPSRPSLGPACSHVALNTRAATQLQHELVQHRQVLAIHLVAVAVAHCGYRAAARQVMAIQVQVGAPWVQASSDWAAGLVVVDEGRAGEVPS